MTIRSLPLHLSLLSHRSRRRSDLARLRSVFAVALALYGAFVFPATSLAADPISMVSSGDGIVLSAGERGFDLVVAGPEHVWVQTIAPGESLTLSALAADGAALADGAYRWEAIPSSTPAVATGDRQVSEAGARLAGTFRVHDGVFFGPSDRAEPTSTEATPFADLPTKDDVFTDDLVVINQACIGATCVDGELLDSTIKVDSNVPSIRFEDSSSLAGFPTNDWEIRANDIDSGGLDRLRFEDIDAGTIPFSIAAGAPSDSLFVAGGGNVGVGTSAPATAIHAIRGNTPSLRLEQDVSSGFSAQTWDLAGNETTLSLRDISGGTRPLQIEAGVANNTFYLDSTNSYVGVGTSSPFAKLTVVDTATVASPTSVLDLSINGPPRFSITNSASSDQWFIGQNVAGAVTFSKLGTASNEMKIDGLDNPTRPGRVTFQGDVYATGFEMLSDRASKHAFESIDAAAMLQKVVSLPISSWSYRGREARHVGPMAQDFQAAFGLGDDDETIGVVDASGVALAAIQGLVQELAARDRTIEALDARNRGLEERLAALERALRSVIE